MAGVFAFTALLLLACHDGTTLRKRVFCSARIQYSHLIARGFETMQLAKTKQLLAARDHLRLALDALDTAGAPAHIGAHVDLAIHQLEHVLPERLGPNGQIDMNAEPQ